MRTNSTEVPQPPWKPTLVFLIPFLVLTGLGLAAKSEVPIFLGRYSPTLLAFNLVNLAALAAIFTAIHYQRYRSVLWAGLFLTFAATYCAGSNNSLAGMPFMSFVTHATRYFSAVLLIVFGVTFYRSEPMKRLSRNYLTLGISLFLIASLEVILGVSLLFTSPRAHSELAFSFRKPVDINTLSTNSIAIIGDSQVWGQGVPWEDTLCSVVQRDLDTANSGFSVYNLGQVGTSLPEYLKITRAIPKAGQIVVVYFMNDMPQRQVASLKTRQFVQGIGRFSPLSRLVGDIIQFQKTPSLSDYESTIISDYDKSDSTHANRWQLLETLVTSIGQEASLKSEHPPLFVIMPMLWRFSEYPLKDIHADLSVIASRAGFTTVDLLPLIAGTFQDGRAYAVAPNDNHYNAELHHWVGKLLAGQILHDSQRSVAGH